MVDRVDIDSVLMQMRQVKDHLRAQQEQSMPMQSPAELSRARSARLEQHVAAAQEVGDATVPDFQTMFKNAIDTVNATQKNASALATRFEQGDPTVDLPEVMIALQKSSVSFQAMTQVRNKLVEAYKDVMNMSV